MWVTQMDVLRTDFKARRVRVGVIRKVLWPPGDWQSFEFMPCLALSHIHTVLGWTGLFSMTSLSRSMTPKVLSTWPCLENGSGAQLGISYRSPLSLNSQVYDLGNMFETECFLLGLPTLLKWKRATNECDTTHATLLLACVTVLKAGIRWVASRYSVHYIDNTWDHNCRPGASQEAQQIKALVLAARWPKFDPCLIVEGEKQVYKGMLWPPHAC